MQSIPIELYNEIITKLDQYGLYCLAHTCKQFFPNYRKFIMNRINDRLLSIFGDHLPALKKIMKKNCCVISGSFVIQMLLGERWKDSDIDFFIPIRNNKITETNAGHLKSDIDDFMYNVMQFDGSLDDVYVNTNMNVIKYTRTYRFLKNKQKPNNKLFTRMQIIGIDVDKNPTSIFDFILKTFDFSICKNMYYYDGIDHIRANDFSHIFSKQSDFEIPNVKQQNVETNFMRYEKYQKREITFKSLPGLDSIPKLEEKYVKKLRHYDDDIGECDTIYHLSGYIGEFSKPDGCKYYLCRGANCVLVKYFGFDTKHYHLKATKWENNGTYYTQEFAIIEKDIQWRKKR